MNSGSSFLAEIKRMTSSFRPRGSVSVSMSVMKPSLYSRLASSAIVLVAVGINTPRNQLPLFFLSLNRKGRKGLILEHGVEGDQADGGFQDRLTQPGPEQVGDLPLVLEQVGQGDL